MFTIPNACLSAPSKRSRRPLAGLAATATIAGSLLLVPTTAYAATVSCSSGSPIAGVLTVADGTTCTISGTTVLDELVISDGGAVVAPDGYDVTLTVDGVETGQAYDSITDAAGTLQAGTYQGSKDGGVVLTVTTRHTEAGLSGTYDFPVRQSLYVDSTGVVTDSSVPASWIGAGPGGSGASDFAVTSTGATFNGIWVDGADYALTDPTISLTGNGRSDFVGAGAALVADNAATVTVAGADIDNAGVVRTAVISDGGANVVVKDSDIDVAGGDLPSDWMASVDFDTMIAAPWMLGLEGTNRATLLLGENSKAAYINSSITAEDWGALSTDAGTDVKLTTINSDVAVTESGYGTYVIGGADGQYLGTDFDVVSYISISANGENVAHFGDSDADSVAALNTARELGLSTAELAALDEQSSTLVSDRIGFMTWAGDNTVIVDGATTVKTGNALFEDKSTTGTTTYNVSGDDDASPSLRSSSNVIVQVMDQDDPGPGGTSTDATAVQSASAADMQNAALVARTETNLTGTSVKGNFFNGATTSKNLVLNLDDATVRGVISSTTASHEGTVTEATYDYIGIVTNEVSAPVNGGVIVSLANGSTWTVTGTSYLTSLTVDADSQIRGYGGKDVTVTIDGADYSPSELTADTTYLGTADSPIIVTVSAATVTSAVSVTVAGTTYGTPGSAVISVTDSEGEPASGEVSVSVDDKVVGTATLTDGAATVSLPATLSVGSHTVKAVYPGSDDVDPSVGTATLKVAKAKPTVSLSLAKSKISKGGRVKATVRVVINGASSDVVATGTVKILDGSKVVAKVNLSKSDQGSETVTLGKFKKSGVHKLTAVYSGNSNVSKATSAKASLRVK